MIYWFIDYFHSLETKTIELRIKTQDFETKVKSKAAMITVFVSRMLASFSGLAGKFRVVRNRYMH